MKPTNLMHKIPKEISDKLYQLTKELSEEFLLNESDANYSKNATVDLLIRFTKKRNEICQYFKNYYICYISLMPCFTSFTRMDYGLNGEWPTEMAASLNHISIQLPYITEPTTIRNTIKIRGIREKNIINYSVAPLNLNISKESDIMSFFDFDFFENTIIDNYSKKNVLLIKTNEMTPEEFLFHAKENSVNHFDKIFSSGFNISGEEHSLLIEQNSNIANNVTNNIIQSFDELIQLVRTQKIPTSFNKNISDLGDESWNKIINEANSTHLAEKLNLELINAVRNNETKTGKGKI